MTTIGTATLELDGDIVKFQAELRKAGEETKKFSDRFSKDTGKLTGIGLNFHNVLGAIAGATGLGLVAREMFEFGSAVEETGSLFRTVFGAGSRDVMRFIDDFARAAGLTTREAQSLTGSMGAMIDAFGGTSEQMVDVSTRSLQLAADIASFNNVSGGADEVMRAMQSAMIGNTEAMRSMNVAFTQNEVTQRALEQTGKDNVQQLTQLEKSMAALEIITERAGVAVGDLERTQDGAANQARALAAEFREMRDDIATSLMPAFEVIMGAIGDLVGGEGFAGFGEAIKANAARIAAWTSFAIETFQFVYQAFAFLPRIALEYFDILRLGSGIVQSFLAMDFEQAKANWDELAAKPSPLVTGIKNIAAEFGDMMAAADLATGTSEIQFTRAAEAADDMAESVAVVAETLAAEPFEMIGVEGTIENITRLDEIIRDIGDQLAEKTFELGIADNAEDAAKLNAEVEALNVRMGNLKAVAGDALDDFLSDENLVAPRELGQIIIGYVDPILTATEDMKDLTGETENAGASAEKFKDFLGVAGNELKETLRDSGPLGKALALAIDPIQKGLKEGASAGTMLFDSLTAIVAGNLPGLISAGLSFIGELLSPGESEAGRLLREQREAIARNSEALQKNTEAILQSLSDIDLDLISALKEAFANAFRFDPNNLVRSDAQIWLDFMETLGSLGFGLGDLEEVAETLGLEFSMTYEFLRQLQEALGFTATSLNDFGSLWDQLRERFNLLDLDPKTQLQDTLDFLRGFFGDDLVDALSGFTDTDFNAWLQTVLDQIAAGGGDILDQIEGVTGSELIEILTFLEGLFDSLGDETLGATEALASFMNNAGLVTNGSGIDLGSLFSGTLENSQEAIDAIRNQTDNATEGTSALIGQIAVLNDRVGVLNERVDNLALINRTGFESIETAAVR